MSRVFEFIKKYHAIYCHKAILFGCQCSVAQFLEWWPCNPRVGGSKLSNGIRKLFVVHYDFYRNFPFTQFPLVKLVCDSNTK